MALIECPDCGNMISALSDQCLHCGRPTIQSPEHSSPDISTKAKTASFPWKSFILSWVLAFAIINSIKTLMQIPYSPNYLWTFLWIFFTIEAWPIWHWRAVLPYISFLSISVLWSLAKGLLVTNSSSWLNIIPSIMFNIGGVTAFGIVLYIRKKAAFTKKADL